MSMNRQQTVTAAKHRTIAKATQLWVALAMRDFALRGMSSSEIMKKYGRLWPSTWDAQQMYMSQVLRFVEQLNSKDDPIYICLKQAVKSLRNQVGRKFVPLHKFLCSIKISGRVAAKLARSLYKKRIKSVASISSEEECSSVLQQCLVDSWLYDPATRHPIIKANPNLTDDHILFIQTKFLVDKATELIEQQCQKDTATSRKKNRKRDDENNSCGNYEYEKDFLR